MSLINKYSTLITSIYEATGLYNDSIPPVLLNCKWRVINDYLILDKSINQGKVLIYRGDEITIGWINGTSERYLLDNNKEVKI